LLHSTKHKCWFFFLLLLAIIPAIFSQEKLVFGIDIVGAKNMKNSSLMKNLSTQKD
jgi:hypothetical protein